MLSESELPISRILRFPQPLGECYSQSTIGLTPRTELGRVWRDPLLHMQKWAVLLNNWGQTKQENRTFLVTRTRTLTPPRYS